MGAIPADKPHAVCIPYPAQGHITPMLKLAKLLHSLHGFHITFVNTEHNHNRLLKSIGHSPMNSLSDFQFRAIPDGLPPSDADATQDIPSLCVSSTKNCLAPFRDLITELNDSSPDSPPPVTCIVSDGCMSFTLDAADELGIPEVIFWTTSACGFLAYLHCKDLLDRGLTPLTGAEDLTDGYLDTPIEWVSGLKNMRLRDFPSFIRTTDPNDIMLSFLLRETGRAPMASGVILNTFDDLERPVLDAMASILPPVYTIGPLSLMSQSHRISSSLWREERDCIEWLDGKEAGSVVYVNFGSITVMTSHQLIEFAWGLANSGRDFLWVIRPDLVRGDSAVLPPEFLARTKGRSYLATWCPQEEVLLHPAVGGFLTHCGWNSTLESLCAGVPMLCWPFFAEQQTNCRYACTEWGVGKEIDSDVRKEEVEGLIRELMGGEKGKELRQRAAEWKEKARRAGEGGGPSLLNLDKLVKEVLLPRKITP